MILLNTLVSDIIFEAVRFVVLAAVMAAGIFVGKKLRDRTDAKRASSSEEK